MKRLPEKQGKIKIISLKYMKPKYAKIFFKWWMYQNIVRFLWYFLQKVISHWTGKKKVTIKGQRKGGKKGEKREVKKEGRLTDKPNNVISTLNENKIKSTLKRQRWEG